MVTYNYCCNDLLKLGDTGYLDGTLLYLQRLDMNTNLPAHLRHYQFCVSCGKENLGHPVDNLPKCLTLRNGMKSNLVGQTGNDFRFNLNTKESSQSEASPTRIDYCPYCGKKYVAPT
ncbi:MAG: hypothetical protein WAM14_16585 [Candidatus Nitrosopolaris sp.]